MFETGDIIAYHGTWDEAHGLVRVVAAAEGRCNAVGFGARSSIVLTGIRPGSATLVRRAEA